MIESSLVEFCQRAAAQTVKDGDVICIFAAGTVVSSRSVTAAFTTINTIDAFVLDAVETIRAADWLPPYDYATPLPSDEMPIVVFNSSMFVSNGYSTRPAVVVAAARHGWSSQWVSALGYTDQFRADACNPVVVVVVTEGKCYRLCGDYFAEWTIGSSEPKNACKKI